MKMELTNSLFVVFCILYLAIRLFYQWKLAGSHKVHSRSDVVDKLLVAFVGAGQVVIPLIYIASPVLDQANYQVNLLQTAVGSVLFLTGLWLFWHSHHDLDSNWSVTLELSEDHRLITNGVYTYIRHPMYAAFFVMSMGQALLLANWIAGCSGFLSILALYVVRIPKEEKMLLDTFAQQYRDYKATTGGVIPVKRKLPTKQ